MAEKEMEEIKAEVEKQKAQWVEPLSKILLASVLCLAVGLCLQWLNSLLSLFE